jgi:hypothetical protein
MKITKGIQLRAQRIVIYSVEGVGKTTFASKFPSPLFIDTEHGSNHIDVAGRANVETWADVLEATKLCARTKEYATLVIDTADGCEDLLLTHLCQTQNVDSIEKLEGGFGKGYVKLADAWGKFLSRDLEAVISNGVHVVLLVHAKADKFTEPGAQSAYDRYTLLQTKQVQPITKGWPDELWFANYKTTIVEEKGQRTIAVGGKERLLFTHHTAAFDAKSRAGLADKIPMNFEAIRHVLGGTSAPIEGAKESRITHWGPEPKGEQHATPQGGHPLDAVLTTDELRTKAALFMEGRGVITKDQTYKDAPADYIERILANPSKFVEAIR